MFPQSLDFWIFDFWNCLLGIFGLLDFWNFGLLDFWNFGLLDFWILDYWIIGFLDFWIFGFLDFGILGFVDYWVNSALADSFRFAGGFEVKII